MLMEHRPDTASYGRPGKSDSFPSLYLGMRFWIRSLKIVLYVLANQRGHAYGSE